MAGNGLDDVAEVLSMGVLPNRNASQTPPPGAQTGIFRRPSANNNPKIYSPQPSQYSNASPPSAYQGSGGIGHNPPPSAVSLGPYPDLAADRPMYYDTPASSSSSSLGIGSREYGPSGQQRVYSPHPHQPYQPQQQAGGYRSDPVARRKTPGMPEDRPLARNPSTSRVAPSPSYGNNPPQHVTPQGYSVNPPYPMDWDRRGRERYDRGPDPRREKSLDAASAVSSSSSSNVTSYRGRPQPAENSWSDYGRERHDRSKAWPDDAGGRDPRDRDRGREPAGWKSENVEDYSSPRHPQRSHTTPVNYAPVEDNRPRHYRKDHDYVTESSRNYDEAEDIHQQRSDWRDNRDPKPMGQHGQQLPSQARRQIFRRQQQPLPYHDPHFEECVEDFLILFTPEELEAEPFLKEYVSEMLARWGRWTARGRAPHLCFEAAALGGLRVLEDGGWSPSERTERIERALAQAMAGLTVDALEPNAASVMRAKAVMLLADEFLARAASPKLATPAKKRAKKRRSRYPVMGVEGDEWDIDMRIENEEDNDDPAPPRNHAGRANGSGMVPSDREAEARGYRGPNDPKGDYDRSYSGTPPPSRWQPPTNAPGNASNASASDEYYMQDSRLGYERRNERRKGSVAARGGWTKEEDAADYARYQQLPTGPLGNVPGHPPRRRRPTQDYYLSEADADDDDHVSIRSDSLRGASPQPASIKSRTGPATGAAQRSASVSGASGRRRGSQESGVSLQTSSIRRPSQDNMPPSPSYAPDQYERRPSVEAISSTAYSAVGYDRRPSLDAMAPSMGSSSAHYNHAQNTVIDYRRPSLDSSVWPPREEGAASGAAADRNFSGGGGGGGGGAAGSRGRLNTYQNQVPGGQEMERRPSLDPAMLRSNSLSNKYGRASPVRTHALAPPHQTYGSEVGAAGGISGRRPSVESDTSATSQPQAGRWAGAADRPQYRKGSQPQTRSNLPISVDPRFEAVESDSDSEEMGSVKKPPPPLGPSRLGQSTGLASPTVGPSGYLRTNEYVPPASAVSPSSALGMLELEEDPRSRAGPGHNLPNPPMPRTSSRRERPQNLGGPRVQ
ncbi:hypothetical protein HDU96_009797 [Phlyctochytrium bullatum]|nr:hypothetical protein HDU96_009797 [Phlyctochytrium bullatum]